MRMTLAKFIESGGIPADDTFYLYHPRVFGELLDCAPDKALLNRRLKCGPVSRLRRKLFYERGLGRVRLHPETFSSGLLFWGMYDGDIMLSSVHSLFDQLAGKSARSHVVVVGATDDSFTESHAAGLPEQITKIFTLNCAVEHPKVHWYPLGRDETGVQFFPIPPRRDKRLKVYCNFSPDTHASRHQILDMLAGRSFVTRVDIAGYGKYTGYPMSSEEFLGQLNEHAFSICPRGAGFDTFRLWDSLHLGVVPIVVKEAIFHEYLAKLPILFLDSVEDFAKLSEHYLQQQYEEMLETEYDFSLLTAEYWYKQFHEVAH